MRVLILYGTTEGQTRRIVRALADSLARCGHEPALVEAIEPSSTPDWNALDAVIVAASLHVGKYQSAVAHFVTAHREAIAARPNAFVSVSLAAASDDPEEIAGAQHCAEEFFEATGWRPEEVVHIAGAFRFTEYDFFKRWAMKLIAWRKGVEVDTKTDLELTDWDALERFATAFGTRIAAGSAG